MPVLLSFSLFFFFNDTATTEIYTLSLHDALPICPPIVDLSPIDTSTTLGRFATATSDRKSTRLNSSHGYISYAVFCLKKKKKNIALSFRHAECTNKSIGRNIPRGGFTTTASDDSH